MLLFLKYCALYIAVSFVTAITWVIVMAILGFMKKPQAKWKDVFGGLGLFSVTPLGAFFILSWFQIYPPRFFEKSIPHEPSLFQKQVDDADQKGKQLVSEFSKPESLTLQQLRDLVDQARDYASQQMEISSNQETQIAQLRLTVDDETKKAQEAQHLAESVKSLTTEQLNAVKFLITKDASEQSKQYFIDGVVVSFPVGIISAVVASALWERFGKKRKQVIQGIENVAQSITSHRSQ